MRRVLDRDRNTEETTETKYGLINAENFINAQHHRCVFEAGLCFLLASLHHLLLRCPDFVYLNESLYLRVN